MFRKHIKTICSCAALLAGAALLAQPPVEARIAGLEEHAEYMALLEEDARLQMREDSVVRRIETTRDRLRTEPEARQQLGERILELENLIFEIRNAKGRLIDRINTIEQEWVLASLDRGMRPAPREEQSAPALAVPEALRRRNLTDNPCFAERLPGEDYAALLRAQQLETLAAEYADRRRTNHADRTLLAREYAAAPTEGEALPLFERLRALESMGRILDDSLAATWNYIFDNKSYAYDYLFEEAGLERQLEESERLRSEAAVASAAAQGEVDAPGLADYGLRKEALLRCEHLLAETLGLTEARDSLAGVLAERRSADFILPRLFVGERYFLDYDSVAFSSVPQYTYRNPIPECRVYERGTIYRILLGTFNTKRAAATFRGAYPLFYLIDDQGRWSYYTGGFAARHEAEAAQALCKRKGFLRPEIVVWNDGQARNLSRDPEGANAGFRLEITATEGLSEAVRTAIASLGEGHELSLAGRHFILSGFDDRAEAERAAAVIAGADASLQIKIGEVAE